MRIGWRAGTPALPDFSCFVGGPATHEELLRKVKVNDILIHEFPIALDCKNAAAEYGVCLSFAFEPEDPEAHPAMIEARTSAVLSC